MKSLILCLLIGFCSAHARVAPLKKVPMPEFYDDLHFENMLTAITRQQRSFNRINLSKKFKFGNKVISRQHLKKSMDIFRDFVVEALNCFQKHGEQLCYRKFNESMHEKFEAYKPIVKRGERGYQEDKTLFTAYYSPDFKGSRVKTDIYKNPIYGLPKEKELRNLTSDEINFQKKLKGKGYELFYVNDSLYDIWLLHVEGGGRVKVKNSDGTVDKFYLSYAGTNKKRFRMLGNYMLEAGMLRRDELSVDNQRKYFLENPQHQREIMASNPSFVFFKESQNEPLGVRNVSLTPNRSMATDYRIYKEYGIISYIKARKPKRANERVLLKEFSRFFINQDTGGAIKGNARADLYFGYGPYAELSANYLYNLGEQFFLILK